MIKAKTSQPITRKGLSRPNRFFWPAYTAVIISVLSLTAYAAAPYPDVPRGKGDQCVEDTELMRAQHMEFLLHQRDETVYKGIRKKDHSLKNCLECHAVFDGDNQPVSYANPKHFCRVCHDYASVSVDCFDCHASKPKSASR